MFLLIDETANNLSPSILYGSDLILRYSLECYSHEFYSHKIAIAQHAWSNTLRERSAFAPFSPKLNISLSTKESQSLMTQAVC